MKPPTKELKEKITEYLINTPFYSLNAIEIELGIGQGTLSKAINATQKLSEKTAKKLATFFESIKID